MSSRKQAATVNPQVLSILNAILSDVSVLAMKTLNFHWNIEGANFKSIHEMFGEQYEDLLEEMDAIAEKIRAYEGRPFSTMSEFLAASEISESPQSTSYPALKMVAVLREDHEKMVATMKQAFSIITEDFGADGIADMLLGFQSEHEQMSWMLQSTIKG